MPELPDIELYRHALRSRVVGNVLERVRLASPFVLRSVDPPIAPSKSSNPCAEASCLVESSERTRNVPVPILTVRCV